MTATRAVFGSGSARRSLATSTTDSSASRRAMSRCAGGSRSRSRSPVRPVRSAAAGSGDQPAVEQAELELLPEHAGGRAVDQLLGDVAGGNRRQQRVAVAAGARQLHVKPGRERQRGRAARVGRDPVLELEEGDREVVGDDDAVEAELVAEQVGQQARVGAGGHAVAVDVGRHHRPGAADSDRHLERGQDDVGELARAHRDRRVVPARPRRGVPGEVLERRLHAGRLQPLHVGGADGADQVRVLADGLLDPAPPVVAGHVEDRREPLVRRRPPASSRRTPPPSRRPAPGRRTRPRPARSGRSWRPRRRTRSGTPRARPPGCRTGCWPRSAPAARPAPASRRRPAPGGCRTPG